MVKCLNHRIKIKYKVGHAKKKKKKRRKDSEVLIWWCDKEKREKGERDWERKQRRRKIKNERDHLCINKIFLNGYESQIN